MLLVVPMISIFPNPKYARLLRLQKHWDIPSDELYYAIENDVLQVCVWMPTRYLERGIIRDRHFIFTQYETKEGFVGIRPQDFHVIASQGSARLRSFLSVTKLGTVLRMPDEPRQPKLQVQLQDVMVLAQDRVEFERKYGLNAYNLLEVATEPPLADFMATEDYRHIRINGEEHHFGVVQARIIETLHNASRTRSPWVHGKTLLDGAGSKGARLRDLFKSKHDWRKLILSDKSGFYRLNVPALDPEREVTHAA